MPAIVAEALASTRKIALSMVALLTTVTCQLLSDLTKLSSVMEQKAELSVHLLAQMKLRLS